MIRHMTRGASNLIRDALGIESEDVVNYCLPKEWPADRERRAKYVNEWFRDATAEGGTAPRAPFGRSCLENGLRANPSGRANIINDLH